MAIRVKDLGTSAQKWARNASAAAPEYGANAVAAGNVWESSTIAAAQNFVAGVTAAGIGDRFRRGVQRAGASKYTSRIASLGQSRYSQGVGEAEGDWQEGFAPFAQVIAGLTLPQRRPRGDPANYARVSVIGNALHARRLAMLGSGT